MTQPPVGSNPVSALVKAEETRVFDGLLKREGGENLADVRRDMQHTMDESVGIYRSGDVLETAVAHLRDLRKQWDRVGVRDKDPFFNTELTATIELDCMLELAEVIASAAVLRKESRGAHSRTDYPKRDDANFLTHSMARRTAAGPQFDGLAVRITKWQPAARVY